jgi:hypothetical protein
MARRKERVPGISAGTSSIPSADSAFDDDMPDAPNGRDDEGLDENEGGDDDDDMVAVPPRNSGPSALAMNMALPTPRALPPAPVLQQVPGGAPRLYQSPAPVPAWSEHAQYPETFRLRVKRREPGGELSELGMVPKDAAIESILHRWPTPGVFYLFPIDAMGREIAPNHPVRKDVPEDHEYLQSRKSVQSMGPAGPIMQSSLPPEVMTLLQSVLSQQAEETKRNDEEMRRREARIAERETLVAKRDTALALDQIGHYQTATTQLLGQFEQRNNTIVQTILALNERERIQQEAAAQRETERMSALHKQQLESQEASHKLMFSQMTGIQKMYSELQESRNKDRDALMERERARLSEDKRIQREWMAAEESRRIEHAETLRASEQSGGIGNLTSQIDSMNKLREAMGLGPLGAEAEEGEKEEKGLLGSMFEMVKEIQRQKFEVEKIKAMARAGLSADEIAMLDAEEDAEDAVASGIPQPVRRLPPPVPMPSTVPPIPAGEPINPYAAYASAAPLNEPARQGGPRAPAGVAPPAAQYALPASQGGGAAVQGPQGLEALKASRIAIRACVQRLAQSTQTEWQGIVMGALMATPAVIDYLRPRSILTALLEGGASGELAEAVCRACESIAVEHGIPVRP